MRRRGRGESGQATVEWVGLVLVVSTLALALATLAGAQLPGITLARALANRLVCAAGLGGESCAGGPGSPLAAAYGAELAALVRDEAPTIDYEEGMRALPVDFRLCREDPCSMGAPAGEVLASRVGLPVTLFVHVIDCRPQGASRSARAGYDCSGERAGMLYVQYWAYYPGSHTLKALPGDAGHHADDWESVQLRIGPGGTDARASSHHGYNHRSGARNWLSDAGIAERSGWGPAAGRYHVSGGSHAGHVWDPGRSPVRWTPGDRLRLIPVEDVARGAHAGTRFAVTPPWRKRVYRDPEYSGTE